MADIKYLDFNGLSHYDGKIKELIPYPTYISGYQYDKTINEVGEIISGSNIITNKLYVEPNSELHTYGSGQYESVIKMHLYDNNGYAGSMDSIVKGDSVITLDRGIYIIEIVGGDLSNLYISSTCVTKDELNTELNDLPAADYVYKYDLPNTTGNIPTVGHVCGETNLFQTTVPFTVYFKGEVDSSSKMTVYAYDVNHQSTGSLEQDLNLLKSDNLGIYWDLNPTGNDVYFKLYWEAPSCNEMFIKLRPGTPGNISISEINDLW